MEPEYVMQVIARAIVPVVIGYILGTAVQLSLHGQYAMAGPEMCRF